MSRRCCELDWYADEGAVLGPGSVAVADVGIAELREREPGAGGIALPGSAGAGGRCYCSWAAAYCSSVTGSSQVVPSPFAVPSSMARWHIRSPAGCSAFRQATPNPQGFRATVARHGKQSEVGQQLLHRLDFLLLALGDGFSQLDGGRVLALSDLGLCHGDGALMVPDHAL
jgi:hypothetical protein